MEIQYFEWFSYLLRWIHVIAAITWIGESFYFMWLDATIQQSPHPDDHIEGEVWMVHGGGYYKVQKHKMRAGALPKTVHWFKWEAMSTWISGFMLLALVYYSQATSYLIDTSKLDISSTHAILLSLILIFGTWFLYDRFWLSRFASNFSVGTFVSCLYLAGLSYFLCHNFTGRGAFIQMGAILGSAMLINVWMRILPAQRRMIAATEKGENPDLEEGKRAKFRSTHNSYITLPVLLIMLSNHFPLLYNRENSWLIMIALFVFGASVRHLMLLWNWKKIGKLVLIPIFVSFAFLFYLSADQKSEINSTPVSFEEVQVIVQKRCMQCHADVPSDEDWEIPPNDLSFSDPIYIKKNAHLIRSRVFVNRDMPFNNKTEITDEERETLSNWVLQGAPME